MSPLCACTCPSLMSNWRCSRFTFPPPKPLHFPHIHLYITKLYISLIAHLYTPQQTTCTCPHLPSVHVSTCGRWVCTNKIYFVVYYVYYARFKKNKKVQFKKSPSDTRFNAFHLYTFLAYTVHLSFPLLTATNILIIQSHSPVGTKHSRINTLGP